MPYAVKIQAGDAAGTTTLTGELTFTDPANQPAPGIFNGLTGDAGNPESIDTGGGSIQLEHGYLRALSGTLSLEANADHVEVLDSVGQTAITLSIVNGVLSQMSAGTPCYSAIGASGATVALDAGDLAIQNFKTLKVGAGFPTADPHVVGEVWNNAGVLTVSAG